MRRPLRSLPRQLLFTGLVGALLSIVAQAADWPRFRGPNGVGVSPDAKPVPTEWSDSKNLAWKTQLPGPGLSSPIVIGDHVFVTCWSGYGVSREDLGEMDDLQRHLICIDRKSGSIQWDKTVKAVQPEEEFRGMFAENGYASHTPVSDGQQVFAFFGKTGLYAYDMEGNELWHKSVGEGDDRRSWGTASSPILYKDLVICPAFIESNSLVAFDKKTGEEKWRQEADGFNSTWGTPVLVELKDGRTDLVVGVPYEIWGINPETGKLRWYCSSVESDSICSSVVAHDDVVYMVEGRNGGAVAIRCGGSGDVSKSHVLWSNNSRGRTSTPLYHNGQLVWVSGGILNRMDAKTGEEIGSPKRLERSSGGGDAGPPRGGEGGGRPPEGGPPGEGRGGFGGFGGGGFGGGGRGGGQDYSSPVISDGKLIYLTRSGDGLVVALGDEPEQIATNKFDSDASNYSATPAISDGQLFIRSNQFLYCVSQQN